MNEPYPPNTPALPPPSGVAEWVSVWRDAVTKPNEQTFSNLAQSPNAKLTTALLWVFLGSLVSTFLTSLVPNPMFNQILQNYNVNTQQFGGRGTFDQLAYVFAAIQTPFALVAGVLGLLSAIPYVGGCFGIISLLLALYVLVLEVMAVKGVNQFGWGQAAASLLLPVLVLCCCLSVGAFAIARAVANNLPGGFPFPTPAP